MYEDQEADALPQADPRAGAYAGTACTAQFPTADTIAYHNEVQGSLGQWTTAGPPTRLHRCSRDQHIFECRHADRCDCGAAVRVPPYKLDVEKGL